MLIKKTFCGLLWLTILLTACHDDAVKPTLTSQPTSRNPFDHVYCVFGVFVEPPDSAFCGDDHLVITDLASVPPHLILARDSTSDLTIFHCDTGFSFNGSGFSYNLCAINTDGSNRRVLVANLGTARPILSPDGQWIIYGMPHLCVKTFHRMRVMGGVQEVIATQDTYSLCSISDFRWTAGKISFTAWDGTLLRDGTQRIVEYTLDWLTGEVIPVSS